MPISNGRYVSPTWINNQAPPINAPELQAITDTLQSLDGIGGSGRGYIIVGTTQSGATLSTCDYLCDGTADDVEINQAIQTALLKNLDVLLLDGLYKISSPIFPTQNIFLCGQAYGTNASSGYSTPNSVTLSFDSSTESSMIKIQNSSNVIHLSNLTLDSSVPCSLIDFGQVFTGTLYMDNVKMTQQDDVTGIVGPTNSFELYANESTLYSSTLSFSASRIEKCLLYNLSFLECGALGQGTDSFFSFNTFYGNSVMTDCQKCTLIGNIFYGSLSLQSGSGSATNHVCACNNIIGNTFAAGNGITLGTGTSYNNVTCNGGVAYQGGTSFTHWSGVTDNGTNNYVSNNMPTS